MSALLNLVLIAIPYDDVMSYIVQFDIDFLRKKNNKEERTLVILNETKGIVVKKCSSKEVNFGYRLRFRL